MISDKQVKARKLETIKLCQFCLKRFTPVNKKQKYCSHNCANKFYQTTSKGKTAIRKAAKSWRESHQKQYKEIMRNYYQKISRGYQENLRTKKEMKAKLLELNKEIEALEKVFNISYWRGKRKAYEEWRDWLKKVNK